MKNYRKIIQIFLSCVLLIYIGFSVFIHHHNIKIFKNILNITTLPNSIKSIDCESPWVVTDALTTCYAEISPSEFDLLLKGYDFAERIIQQTSHSYNVAIKVGNDFPVTSEFKVEPKNFMYGGHVILLTNNERSKIILDLYEE